MSFRQPCLPVSCLSLLLFSEEHQGGAITPGTMRFSEWRRTLSRMTWRKPTRKPPLKTTQTKVEILGRYWWKRTRMKNRGWNQRVSRPFLLLISSLSIEFLTDKFQKNKAPQTMVLSHHISVTTSHYQTKYQNRK